MRKTAQMRLTEIERGSSIEQLIAAGIDQGWTQVQIAADLGVSLTTLIRWCEQLGLEVVWRPTLVRRGELAGV